MASFYQNNINRYIKDGARPAKFEAYIVPPEGINLQISTSESPNSNANLSGPDASKAFTYFCYAASFPGITSEPIEFKFRGKAIPIPGVSTPNQSWSATFYNDEKHAVRRLFKEWIELVSPHNYNDAMTKIYTQTSIVIYQYDYELKNKVTGCQLIGVFPISMSDVEVSYENLSQVESFQVEFKYAYFEYFDIAAGLSADAIKQQIKSLANKVVNGLAKSVTNFIEGTETGLLNGDTFSEWSSKKVEKLLGS